MTISHSASCSIWYRRAVDGGSDQSDQYCQVQSRVSLPVNDGGRLFQACLGRARKEQDGSSCDGGIREDFEDRGTKPRNLQTDDGKEFYNKTFQDLMKRKDIHDFSTSGDTKACVVERFNRTLKQRLYRYFTTKNTLNFVPVLQDLVKGYNRSYHRSIKRAPNEVTETNSPEVWTTLYGKTKGKIKKPRFKVGDRVRLNEKFRQFKKGYLPGWTEEVFVVKSVCKGRVPTYKVDEWDGSPVKGTFYAEHLQNVAVEDDDLFRIDKIVKRKGDKVLVRWKGWPDKYDTWLNKKDVKP